MKTLDEFFDENGENIKGAAEEGGEEKKRSSVVMNYLRTGMLLN